MTRLCRHCHAAPISRPRRLCWVCFYAPGVRELYPPSRKFTARCTEHGNAQAPLPAEPAPYLPGTPEKEALLRRRAERGEQLFHPRDGVQDEADASRRIA